MSVDMDYFRNFIGPVEECLRNGGIDRIVGEIDTEIVDVPAPR